MKFRFFVLSITAILSLNVYAEKISGHILPGAGLVALGQTKTQLKMCNDCQSEWHNNADNIIIREYSDLITQKQALSLLLKRSHPKIYVGLGVETGAVYYINFGNIEGPFDTTPNEEINYE